MIETKNLTKIYNPGKPNEVVAIKDANVKIEDGSIVVLRGPSGCGKTTLLSMLGLILTPTYGSIIIDGEDVTKYSDYWKTTFRRYNIGFIFQHINLLPQYSALENALIPHLCRDVDVFKEYKQRALEWFEKFKVLDRAHHLVEQLSGGEQQRVALVRALITDPKYILADEPTVFVDEETSQIIREVFLELRDQGKCIVVATHDPRLAEIADKTYIFGRGVIVKEVRGASL
ncbi:MAG TPA: ABC transporter ATP-binding protein [Candidatus Methanomethylia archaeon]|nr:ABC transporter ATP-binding protein [Candidatus Methanomethylicia archaeon]